MGREELGVCERREAKAEGAWPAALVKKTSPHTTHESLWTPVLQGEKQCFLSSLSV